MRVAWVMLVILAAGCASDPAGPDDPANTTPAPGSDEPLPNETLPATGMGERLSPSTEHFVFMPDHTLAVVSPGDPELAEAKVPESLPATGFWQSFAQPLVLAPWSPPPSQTAWESTSDIEILIRFSSDSAAASTNPRAAGFPPVGGWFGTTDRFAFFLLANDAPDTLEAGKVYESRLVAKPPQGGFFVLEGEQLALHAFLSYQTADGKPASYVVGGAQPAGFLLPHSHFNMTASTQTVVLQESGELPPNPAPTGDAMRDPPQFSFSVPADALYVIGEVEGAALGGTRADVDLTILSAGGDVISAGTSPAPTERVAIGPGNLKAYGRDLTARVTGATMPAGGTFTLTITAYSP